MVGRARLVCDIDERWNGPPPRCEPILCPPPSEIPNGRFTISSNLTTVGSVVEYSCDSRKFKLVGPKKLLCLPIGQYDKSPPICKEEPGRPLGGIIGAVNKATAKPTIRPYRPPIVTQATYSPVKPNNEFDGVTRRPTKIPTSRPQVIFSTTEKAYVTPVVRTTAKTTEAKPPQVPAGHPQENEIPDSVHILSDAHPNANIPSSVEEDRRETAGARLNLGTHFKKDSVYKA